MKKLLIGLLTAILMTSGAVAVTGSTFSASAECGNPQYPACFETTVGTQVFQNGNRPKRRVIQANVNARGSNANPVGRVRFTFTRPNGTTFTITRRVVDGRAVVGRRFRMSGQWSVRATFIARDGSVFDDDSSRVNRFNIP